MEHERRYNAALYVRLSREDGDKAESDSIRNQKELIKNFLKTKTEITLCREMVDDGFSGVDFNRPAFLVMLEEIKSKKINCVVVKDFSRLGRNYIEAGRYIEKVFPFLGVRFISVNDNYDSLLSRSRSDNIIIPFKNLINDAYSRDISVKIRSQLEVKRRKGDYTGSFPVYGYIKSPDTKSKLEVDTIAAGFVRDIFNWKLEGMSNRGIADRLNEMGILSPLEYKKAMGSNYSTGFQIKPQTVWTAPAIRRILTNEIYTGVLEQGKRSTLNHRIRKQTHKDKKDWIRVENTHEPIISREQFDLVSSLLLRDTRIAPTKKTVHLFSGILCCAGCGQNMVRKTIPCSDKKYIYYICSTSKAGGGCTSHGIGDASLREATLHTLRYIGGNLALGITEYQGDEEKKIEAHLQMMRGNLARFENLRATLYEDMRGGLLDKAEYLELKTAYSERCAKIKSGLLLLENKKQESMEYEQSAKQKDNCELDRKTLLTLINKIMVYENGRIDIHLSKSTFFKVGRRCNDG